jgi:hypothetical protein
MTLAGMVSWEAAQRPGIWRRAGMDGSITGLDLAEAMITAHAHFGQTAEELDDTDLALVDAFAAIEIGALDGIAATKPTPTP